MHEFDLLHIRKKSAKMNVNIFRIKCGGSMIKDKIKKDIKDDKSSKMLLIYDIAFIIVGICVYFFFPIIFSFPPNSINNNFEVKMTGLYAWKFKAIIITTLNVLAISINYKIQVSKIQSYKNLNDKQLEKFKKHLFRFENVLNITNAIWVLMITFFVMYLTGSNISLSIGATLVNTTLLIMSPVMASHIILPIRNDILTALKNDKRCKKSRKATIKKQMLFNLFSITFGIVMMVAFLMIFIVREKSSELIFNNYNIQLSKSEIAKIDNLDEAKNVLMNITKNSENDTLFIVTNEDVLYSDTNKEISEFFKRYLFEFKDTYHAYDEYGIYNEGAFRICNVDGKEIAIGIMYETIPQDNLKFIFISLTVLIIFTIVLMYIHVNNVTKNILIASKALTNISNKVDVDFDKKLIVLEDNEYGDIAIAYNKFLDSEKEHNEMMKRNQEILMEQERLASLGQLIGSLAHNLKTPIMSISGACEGIKGLTEEYKKSIDSPQVTREDHHEIAEEINEWNEKIKTYIEYMSEIINTTKGQAVSMNASEVVSFTVEELLARIHILLSDELMHRGCVLKVEASADKETVINGEISAIVQVIDNLIMNSIDAYDGRNGEIILRIKEGRDEIYIEVEDFAGGIPKKVQDKLFKEMITTKGKNGTGIGLYMSYLTIKGKFKGNISFETQEGEGTKFIIKVAK